jgi:superfamily II DNA or RNA helicase
LYLPPLHDFQEEVMEGISALIPRDNFRRRAVVSLPTGGGKTRVTVQAAVELVLKPEGERRSVVWIAQTDELCEQAVQAVRQVWVNLGAQGTDLRIIRLWGGQATPDEQPMDKPIVVVASVQTLNNRFGGLDWLSSPGLVVMDECHHAIAPSYTSVLRWLDAEAPRLNQKEKPKEEPPIIGLSATPFRTDEDESARLAKRFDNIWFPPKQDTLYAQLLATNVLSRIKTDALASNVALIASEMELLERLEREEVLNKPEGIKALEEIDNRLADIVERNALIAERITQALAEGEAKSILFFANSVKHARKMSVLLNKAGVSAAPIDGETPRSARRDFLAKFQRGEIKVLCNHSVLTTGFDSPKTDMILISRTIFSPVAYMQIVGRGLRGPKNGGTLECLLITVKDNIGRFIDRYAYHYCQRYFNQITEGSAHAANVLK